MADEDLVVRVGLTEKQYLAALARMEKQSIKAAKGAETAFSRNNRNFVRGTERANKAANGFANGGLRNISMQLSQVAQQGAVTGNYFQALTIQAADIGLAFGTMGIAIGAAISVLGPLAQGFLMAGDAAKETEINIQQAYNAAESAIDRARTAQDRYTDAIRLTGVAQAEVTPEIISQLREEAKAREALAALEIARLERQRLALQESLKANRAQLDALMPTDVSDDPTGSEFFRSASDRRQLEIVQGVLEANEELVLTIREQQAELDLVNSMINQGHGEAAEFVDVLTEAVGASESISSSIASVDFSAAISGAVSLSQQLDISLHRAMQIMGLVGAAAQAARDRAASPVLDPREPGFDPIKAEMARIQEEGYGTTSPFAPSRLPRSKSGRGRRRAGRSGRSGGMSEAAREQAQFAREAQRYIEQTRTALERYNEELAKLEMLNEKGFFKEAPEAYARAVAQLEEEFRQTEFENVLRGVESISEAMANAIVNGENMGEALRGVIRQLATDLISSGLQQGLGSLFTGGGRSSRGGLFGRLFAGFFDQGGTIPAGQFGIAGENGPEIIRGPANVTSTKDTAAMMGGAVVRVELSPGLQGAILQKAASQSVQIVQIANSAQQSALPGQIAALQESGEI